MQVDVDAYKETVLDYKLNRKWHKEYQSLPEVSLTADTGALVTCKWETGETNWDSLDYQRKI